MPRLSAPFYRSASRLASNSDGFLLVWQDTRGTIATRLDQNGTALDLVGIRLSSEAYDWPSVVWARSLDAQPRERSVKR